MTGRPPDGAAPPRPLRAAAGTPAARLAELGPLSLSLLSLSLSSLLLSSLLLSSLLLLSLLLLPPAADAGAFVALATGAATFCSVSLEDESSSLSDGGMSTLRTIKRSSISSWLIGPL